MAKTVKGFQVRNQDRRKIRSELSGSYEGRDWFVRSEEQDLFSWVIGNMSGYAGPTLADTLRTMKKAARAQTQLEAIYGNNVPEEAYNALRLIFRWERRALQGRLKITGPHGKGEGSYYRVSELNL